MVNLEALQTKQQCDFRVHFQLIWPLSLLISNRCISMRMIIAHELSRGNLEYLVHSELCDLFPEVDILCRMFLTLPIGIASAEREMSVVRRVKTYLRSEIGQDRFSSLAKLAIGKKQSPQILIYRN